MRRRAARAPRPRASNRQKEGAGGAWVSTRSAGRRRGSARRCESISRRADTRSSGSICAGRRSRRIFRWRPGGRSAVAELERLSQGRLDGLVAAAGLGASHEPIERIVAVNYFGCVALIDGARGMLVASGRGSGAGGSVGCGFVEYRARAAGFRGTARGRLPGGAGGGGARGCVEARRAALLCVGEAGVGAVGPEEAPEWMQAGGSAQCDCAGAGPDAAPGSGSSASGDRAELRCVSAAGGEAGGAGGDRGGDRVSIGAFVLRGDGVVCGWWWGCGDEAGYYLGTHSF